MQKLAEAASRKQEKVKRRSQILKFKKRKSNKVFMTHTATQENCAPTRLIDLENQHSLHVDTKNLKMRRVSKTPFKVLDAPQL